MNVDFKSSILLSITPLEILLVILTLAIINFLYKGS